jgi:hypothetical protein
MILSVHIASADEIAPLKLPHSLELCGERIKIDDHLRERLETRYYAYFRAKSQMILWMKRTKKFFPIIEKALSRNGLPDDLKYMTVVESALIQRSYSPKGAVGVWQFMRGTGRRFGLTVNKNYDERRDVFKATDAAIKYFNFLYDKFGNWPLVMAAYNIGENRIAREVREQESDNFFDMTFPRETDEYVINVLIVKHIMEHPKRYGLDLSEDEFFAPFDFKEVNVKVRTYRKPVSVIAKAAKTSVRTIKELNPSIVGNFIYNGIHVLRVPPEGDKGFYQRYDDYLAKYEDDSTYVKVTNSTAALRSGPGRDYKKVRVVREGDMFRFLSTSHGLYNKKPWYEVEVKNKSYWVWSGLVTIVN